MSWYDYQRGLSDGQNSTPIDPETAAIVGWVGIIGFLLFLAVAIPTGILVFSYFAVHDYFHDEAVAAKAAKAKAALIAHEKALINNRKPFTFDGYTLYSGPANAKYLSFRITNSQGQVIYRQPAWMNDKVVSEDKPIANIANHTYLHPGQIHFGIFGNGPAPHGRMGKLYTQFISIDRAGKVTWASPNMAPLKPKYAYNPNAPVYVPTFHLTAHKPKPVHWDAAFVMEILEASVHKYL